MRHALRNRTIIVAQRREDIPFDMIPHENHVYDWSSEPGRQDLKDKIRELLEVDNHPDRPDNPVSGFLGISEEYRTNNSETYGYNIIP